MTKPRLLDLFCGAGGAAMGYHLAGFEVVGVDLNPQPRYPFEFHQADALTFPLDGYDVIHASPPCQAYSTLATLTDKTYPDLYVPIRDRLIAASRPWIIENVIGAPYRSGFVLCGSSFGLRIRRHRNFETSTLVMNPPRCDHAWQNDKIYPALNGQDRKRGGRSGIVGVYGNGGDERADLWPEAMGIDWMTRKELTQAIPPAYTEWIGSQLLASFEAVA